MKKIVSGLRKLEYGTLFHYNDIWYVPKSTKTRDVEYTERNPGTAFRSSQVSANFVLFCLF